MTVVIESGLGYLHHQLPPLSPDQITAKLEAENSRRNPGEGLKVIAPSPTPPASEPIQAQPPPAPTL